MAIFHRSKIENRVEFSSVEKEAISNSGSMKIEWPGFSRSVISCFEFILFAVISGFCCWGLSYIVTMLVSKFV